MKHFEPKMLAIWKTSENTANNAIHTAHIICIRSRLQYVQAIASMIGDADAMHTAHSPHSEKDFFRGVDRWRTHDGVALLMFRLQQRQTTQPKQRSWTWSAYQPLWDDGG